MRDAASKNIKCPLSEQRFGARRKSNLTVAILCLSDFPFMYSSYIELEKVENVKFEIEKSLSNILWAIN